MADLWLHYGHSTENWKGLVYIEIYNIFVRQFKSIIIYELTLISRSYANSLNKQRIGTSNVCALPCSQANTVTIIEGTSFFIFSLGDKCTSQAHADGEWGPPSARELILTTIHLKLGLVIFVYILEWEVRDKTRMANSQNSNLTMHLNQSSWSHQSIIDRNLQKYPKALFRFLVFSQITLKIKYFDKTW